MAPGAIAGRRCWSPPLRRSAPPGSRCCAATCRPGKPGRLRTEHFPRLRAPVLFVQGTADPFGSIVEVSAAIAAIPASTRLLPIDGAGHDLRRGRFDLAAVVAAFLALAPGP